MATLRISRCSEYANRLRVIKLFLDNKEVGTISNGETKDFEISEGTHVLQAKIDWCSSNILIFPISEEATKAVDLTSFAKHNPLGVFATIYYITFGSSKFLHLKERA